MRTKLGDVEKQMVNQGFEVKVHYLRDGDNVPYSAMAMVYDPNMLYVGVGQSFCNPKDQFVKKIGRHIAVVRAVKQMEEEQRQNP